MLVAVHARLLAPDLGGAGLASLVGLAASGTLVVYGLDRTRGAASDAIAWPERAEFARRHRRALEIAVGVGGLLAIGCVARQPPAGWALCGAVGALGLWHRRLKTRPAFKIAYLTLAWWAVVVGLPAMHMGAAAPPGRFATAGVATALALLGNLIGSNAASRPAATLGVARTLAGLGVLVALLGEPGVRALAWVPAVQCLALLPAGAGERARLWRVDGSLAIGAAITLVTLALR